MSSLPDGWRLEPLDEIAEVRLGRQRSPRNHSGTNMRSYLRAANIGWSGLLLDDVKEMNFTDEEMATYRLEPGDIVLGEASGSPDEVGKPALWSGEIEHCAFQNTLLRVRSRGPEPRYLLYWLRQLAVSGAFAKRSRGVGIHHIGRSALAAWAVPVPPLVEQRRIVEILEDSLSRINAGIRALESAMERMAALRASTMLAALRSAGGDLRSLEELSVSVRNGIFVSRAKPDGGGVPILRIGSVRQLTLDLSDVRYSERDEGELAAEGALLTQGDLLFTRYNGNPAYVGACAVVPSLSSSLTYPDKLIRVIIDRNIAVPEFIAIACSVGEGRAQIQAAVKTTAGQAGVAGRELKRVALRVPSLSAQSAVADAVNELLDHESALRRVLVDARRRAEAVRASLLVSAFSGRLTTYRTNNEAGLEFSSV